MRRTTLAILFVVAASAQDGGRRGVTAEDYLLLKEINDARISPDGKRVAYAVVSIDEKQNRRNTQIWEVSVDGSGQPRALTSGPSSRAPRWSPDGESLAFVSTRPASGGGARHADKPQVFLLSTRGGEPRRLTDIEDGVDAFQWSPDGSRMVATSKTRPAGKPASKSDVRHYLSMTYKFNDSGWFDDRRTHLFVVDAKTGGAKQITSGDGRNDTDPQWSPDGTKIAFVGEDTGRPVLAGNDVWVAPAEGGALAKINDVSGAHRLARWSPDGARIAYSGAPTEADAPAIWIASSAGGGKAERAARSLDLSPSDLFWAHDGWLWFTAGVRGESHLYRLRGGSAGAVIAGSRVIQRADIHEGLVVWVANGFQHPGDLYASSLSGAGERQLTHVNAELLARLDLQDVERIPYRAGDGLEIEGFFVKPAGWQAGKSYPMVLSIHGGPAGMYGVGWFHEFQVYASRGWAVFFTNPRGSTGYGAKFQRAVALEWGGKAYTDIMQGVDAILARYSWIDRTRLGVTGGSYGGFMTNWIVSHTDRFKAAVTLRAISNFVSDEGTRDAAYGHARDFGGDLFENYQFYWDSSPLKYAKNVKTPTLVLHSDNDQRVPLEQGEQWFRALKRFGVNTEFVIFPRENHNLTRSGEPKHVVESLNWQVYWFERFLDGNASAVRPNER